MIICHKLMDFIDHIINPNLRGIIMDYCDPNRSMKFIKELKNKIDKNQLLKISFKIL